MARSQVVLPALGLHEKATLQDMNGHFPTRRVPSQAPAWLEREEDIPDGRAMEDRDLTMAVLRRMVFSPQLGQ